MPRPKKQDAQDTRENALKAADTLLHEYGYLGMSMDAVAKAVGVRKASLYHHFPEGKEELMLTLAERNIAHDASGFQKAISAHGSAQAQLEAVAFFFLQADVQTSRVLRDALRFMPEMHQRLIGQKFYGELYSRVQNIFDEGVAGGEFRPHDTEFSSWAFLGLVSELGTLEGRANKMLSEQIVELMVHGLSP